MLAKKGESPAPVIGNEALKIDSGNCLSSTAPLNATQAPAKRYDAAISTLLLLRQRFPLAFARLNARTRQPLKVGVRDAISAQMPDHNPADIALALKIYTGHSAYLRQCTENAERIGLDGEVVGVVTKEQAAHAAELIAKRRKGRPQAAPAPVSPPKKISLSDLKAAAARKRNAMAGA
jgi:sRNA-binding protein